MLFLTLMYVKLFTSVQYRWLFFLKVNTNDNKAVPWLRQLVVGLSLRRSEFGSGKSICGLWCTNWQCSSFFSEFFGLPCQYHSTVALHTHTQSGGWTIGSQVAADQIHNLTPLTWTTTKRQLLHKQKAYQQIEDVSQCQKFTISTSAYFHLFHTFIHKFHSIIIPSSLRQELEAVLVLHSYC
jgi:hypothetical protein